MRRRPVELWIAFALMLAITAIYAAVTAALNAAPRSSTLFGHGIGVLGFILMLMTETLYSLRKRTSWLNWAGPVRYWLSLHIVTGIVGPFMVLMHTGLQFRGLAGVSFILTLIVVGSGFMGRYLYTALPRTISGVTTSRQALEREIGTISQFITQFEAQKSERVQKIVAELSKRQSGRNPFLTILGRSYYQWRYQRRLKQQLKQLDQLVGEQKQQLGQLLTRRRDLQRQIDMLEAARRVMRVWHILHIPFGLTLFFSVALHVFATLYFRAGLFK